MASKYSPDRAHNPSAGGGINVQLLTLWERGAEKRHPRLKPADVASRLPKPLRRPPVVIGNSMNHRRRECLSAIVGKRIFSNRRAALARIRNVFRTRSLEDLLGPIPF